MSEEKFHILNPHDLVECPYEKAHMIEQNRMVYHLLKCRANHPGNDYTTCPFNATHDVPKVELRYHMMFCHDRVRIENDLIHAETIRRGNNSMLKGYTDVPEYNLVPLKESTEDWDTENASDKYVHMPVIPKESKIQRQNNIKQYYLNKKKPVYSSMMTANEQLNMQNRKIDLANNPIYAMSINGVTRGLVKNDSGKINHRDIENDVGANYMTSKEMSKGRGRWNHQAPSIEQTPVGKTRNVSNVRCATLFRTLSEQPLYEPYHRPKSVSLQIFEAHMAERYNFQPYTVSDN